MQLSSDQKKTLKANITNVTYLPCPFLHLTTSMFGSGFHHNGENLDHTQKKNRQNFLQGKFDTQSLNHMLLVIFRFKSWREKIFLQTENHSKSTFIFGSMLIVHEMCHYPYQITHIIPLKVWGVGRVVFETKLQNCTPLLIFCM